jgi:hypothetical protein
MGIAFYVLFIALNVLVGGHGAYQFTPMGGFVTDNHVLRYITNCKSWWSYCYTQLRYFTFNGM